MDMLRLRICRSHGLSVVKVGIELSDTVVILFLRVDKRGVTLI